MATALSQSDAVYPFSDCSIASLFPRTIGLSISVGDAMFESEDQDIVSNLVKSTAMENFTNGKLISNIDCSNTCNVSRGDGNTISTKRSNEGQVEMQGKRVRQRRPGLPGVERGGNIFNFLANTTAIGASEIGTSHLSKRRSSCDVAMDSQSWPVIDYSCLENITDPTEYFSTYRMLENAEEEVKRLKGDASSRVSRPQDRRDRQRRPGLSYLEGTKTVFKFPGIGATVGASPSENSSMSCNTELVITSSSNEIRQTENSGSDVDNENDELQVLFTKCREIDNADLPNILREALQINPIRVKKSRGLPFSVTTGTKSESKHGLVSPVTKENKIDGLSTMKGRLSLINLRGNPFFLDNHDEEKQSDLFKGLCSTGKNFCNDGMVKDNKLENLKSDFKDVRVDVMSKSEMEILKNKLLDKNEMKNPVAGLSALKMPIPLIDIQGRLDKISNLKRHILQSTTEGENMIFTRDDFEDSSLSNNREVHDLSPLDVIHLHGSCLEIKSACVPHFSNGKQFSFVDEVHSPVAGILEANKNICGGKISDPKGGQFSLLEKEKCLRSDEIICDKELVHDSIFEKSGQASSLVDFRVSKRLSNEVYSPVAEVSGADKNKFNGKALDPKGCQFSLLEKEACASLDGIICDKELVSDTKFEEASSSVDFRGSKSLSNPFSDKLHPVFVSSETTDNSGLYVFGSSSLVEIQISTSTQQTLHADVPKDPCLPRKPALMDEQMDASNSEKNKNQRHPEASGGSRQKKLIKKKPVSRQKKQNQMIRRQSLAEAGTVWETGVRRSTRIRMKPLQYWCGERLLYGRVHDSLATVIGVKKFGTPQSGKTAVMKVKSYVSDDYADLVAQAALH